jgi:hypothetical protein
MTQQEPTQTELVNALQRLVNLSSHPLFIPQTDLPAWAERVSEARELLTRVQA